MHFTEIHFFISGTEIELQMPLGFNINTIGKPSAWIQNYKIRLFETSVNKYKGETFYWNNVLWIIVDDANSFGLLLWPRLVNTSFVTKLW